MTDNSQDTYMPPEHGWTCFHCGETFMHANMARNHFGASIDAEPGCILRMQPGEQPLLRKVRGLEHQLREVKIELARYVMDDSDKDREIAGLKVDHAVALRREEEKGYARGLADARHEEYHGENGPF